MVGELSEASGAAGRFPGSAIGPPGLILASGLACAVAGAAMAAESVVNALARTVTARSPASPPRLALPTAVAAALPNFLMGL